MLSAGNLNGIEDAGFSFIVGSRITKAHPDQPESTSRILRLVEPTPPMHSEQPCWLSRYPALLIHAGCNEHERVA
jgi:hypothetical protein